MNTLLKQNFKKAFNFRTYIGKGRAKRRPTLTNYDVGSATWAGLRTAPFQSAMKVTALGHGSS